MSTQDQAAEDKVSLDVQLRELRRTAADLGYDVVREIRIAISGRKQEAPHLKRITELAQEGVIEAVFFYSSDRSFRDTSLGLQHLKNWSDLGIKIYWGRREVDVRNSDSKMTATFELAVHANRADKLREAALKKHEYAMKGRYYGREVPLGYVRDGKKLTIRTELIGAIRQVFADVAEHLAFGALTLPAAQGLALDRPSLRAMVRNPIYKGFIRLGKAEHEYLDQERNVRPYQIVDDELWRRAQEGLDARPRRTSSAKFAALAHSLGDAVVLDMLLKRAQLRCHCGEPAHRNGIKEVRGREVPQLTCPRGHTFGAILAHEIDDVTNPQLTCFGCKGVGRSQFEATAVAGGYRISCRECGWNARSPRNPYLPQPPEPSTDEVPVRSLDDFPI